MNDDPFNLHPVVVLSCSLEIGGQVCQARQHIPRLQWFYGGPEFQADMKQEIRRALVAMAAEDLDIPVQVTGDEPTLDEFLSVLLDDACE